MSTSLMCPHCQRPIAEEDTAFCPHCGTPLHTQTEVERLTPDQLINKPLPDVLKQYDSIAGNIVTIAGVLITFYAAGIFASKINTNTVFTALVYALPLVLLLIAIIFALRVFYPRGYITNTYMELIDIKEKRLQYSAVFFGIAVCVLAVGLFVYLIRPV